MSSYNMPFTIADVCNLINLRVRRRSSTSAYVDCPFCNHDKGKMNINFQKNVFRCNYCGEAGGVTQLYAKVYGIPQSDAYREICDALNLGYKKDNAYNYNHTRIKPKFENISKDIEIIEPAGSENVHQTFSYFFSMLTLAKTHKENLIERGLNEDDIEKQGYKTTPAFGYTKIVKTLIEQGCKLEGVPGFYIDKNGEWTVNINKYSSGILVPVMSIEGKIQGAQIRLDNPKESKRRYMWLSSVDKTKGITSGSPVHFVGDPTDKVIYLTEGPIKANVAHALCGKSFIAVAGVNNLSALNIVLQKLKENQVKEIVEVYDMDKYQNEHVLNGSKNLNIMLNSYGIETRRMKWDPHYKGIDDYLLMRKQTKNNT